MRWVGFLLQGTFYADDDAAFIGKVFGDVFTVFIIELAQHAFSYKYDIMAYLPSLSNNAPFSTSLRMRISSINLLPSGAMLDSGS